MLQTVLQIVWSQCFKLFSAFKLKASNSLYLKASSLPTMLQTFFDAPIKACFNSKARSLTPTPPKKNHSTQDSHVVPLHGTNWAALCLTAQIGRDAVLSKSYGRGCNTTTHTQLSLIPLSIFTCQHRCRVQMNLPWSLGTERNKRESSTTSVEQIFRTRA